MNNTASDITNNYREGFIKYYTDYIKHLFPKDKTNKYYALMTFKLGNELKEDYEKAINELDLNNADDFTPFEYDAETWYTDKIKFFTNGTEALNRYSESTNVVQLISADSKKELAENMADTYINMNDESWRIKNLYPYI